MADRGDLFVRELDGVPIPEDVLAYESYGPDSWALSFRGRQLHISARVLGPTWSRREFKADRWEGSREDWNFDRSDTLAGVVSKALAHLDSYRQAGMSMMHNTQGVVARYHPDGQWSEISEPSWEARTANHLFRQAHRHLYGVNHVMRGSMPEWSQMLGDVATAGTVAEMSAQISRLADAVRAQAQQVSSAGFDDDDPARRMAVCAAKLVEVAAAERVLWRVGFSGEGREPMEVIADNERCARLLAKSYSPFADAVAEVAKFRVGLGYLPEPGSVEIAFRNAISTRGRETVHVRGSVEQALDLAQTFNPYNNTAVLVRVVASAHIDGVRAETIAAWPSREKEGVPSVYDALNAVRAAVPSVQAGSVAGSVAGVVGVEVAPASLEVGLAD